MDVDRVKEVKSTITFQSCLQLLNDPGDAAEKQGRKTLPNLESGFLQNTVLCLLPSNSATSSFLILLLNDCSDHINYSDSGDALLKVHISKGRKIFKILFRITLAWLRCCGMLVSGLNETWELDCGLSRSLSLVCLCRVVRGVVVHKYFRGVCPASAAPIGKELHHNLAVAP